MAYTYGVFFTAKESIISVGLKIFRKIVSYKSCRRTKRTLFKHILYDTGCLRKARQDQSDLFSNRTTNFLFAHGIQFETLHIHRKSGVFITCDVVKLSPF